MSEPRRGITLIEVLVVIAIIAILIGLLIPATRRSCGAAGRARCHNNVKQILLAWHAYADTHPGTPTFPAGCFGSPDRSPDARLSWQVELLPYLEENILFQQLDPTRGFNTSEPLTQKVIPTLRCPLYSPSEVSMTSYVAMAGIGQDAATRPSGSSQLGVMGYDRKSSYGDISDGLSNTIVVTETTSHLGYWAQGGTATLRGFDPQNANLFGQTGWLGSLHPGGFTAGMGDGSVRYLTVKVDPSIFADFITIAGGETSVLD